MNHILQKLVSLGYIFVADSMGLLQPGSQYDVVGCETYHKMAITPFKVIQGHRFWYRFNHLYDFLFVLPVPA